MRRFFLDASLKNESKIIIENEEHTHLAYVLRMKVGDMVCICFNDGLDYICEIESISKSQTCCIVKSIEKNHNNLNVNITLFQDLIKMDNFDLVVQKATELGVQTIVPFTSKYCQIQSSKVKLDRLNKIAKEATKQCEGAVISKVNAPLTFNELINEFSKFDIVVFANEREDNFTLNQTLKNKKYKNIAVVVGCEGGFSSDEIEKLVSLNNVISTSLGKRILKAETASIVAITLTLNTLGEI